MKECCYNMQGRIQRFSLGGGAHGERVEREPITGVWGRSPQRDPLVEVAESFWALERPTKPLNSPSCLFLQGVSVAARPVLATFGMSVCLSVCPSVRLSVTRWH